MVLVAVATTDHQAGKPSPPQRESQVLRHHPFHIALLVRIGGLPGDGQAHELGHLAEPHVPPPQPAAPLIALEASDRGRKPEAQSIAQSTVVKAHLRANASKPIHRPRACPPL